MRFARGAEIVVASLAVKINGLKTCSIVPLCQLLNFAEMLNAFLEILRGKVELILVANSRQVVRK